MRMPGYWVSRTEEGVSLTRVLFDETELDPATNWQEVYQNQDPQVPTRGYVAIEAALAYGRSLLPDADSSAVGLPLPQFSDEVLEFQSRQAIDRFASSIARPVQ